MADLICPTCGKSNAEGSEKCWFCQRPLQAAAPSGAEAAGDLPDWLTGLGGTQPPESPAQPAGEDVPEWLQRIRERDRQEKGDEGAEDIAGTEPPDWMASLRPQEEEAVPADVPDWLSGLGAGEENAEEEEPAVPAEAPDWLSQIGMGVEAPAEAEAQAEEAVPAETPDWLAGLSAAAETPGVEEPAEEIVPAEAPDWLSQIGMGVEAPAEAEAQAEEAVPAEAPDWLSGLGAGEENTEEEEPAEEAVPAEAPDWLSQIGMGKEAPAEEAVPAETPDWLAGLSAVEQTPAEVESQAEEAAPAEVPDWMADLSTAGAVPAFSDLPDAGDAKMPDWLTGMDTAADLPDWLATEKLDDETDGSPSTPAFVSLGETDAANWLPGPELPVETGETPAVPSAFTVDAQIEGESAGTPDWLAGLAPTDGEMGEASSAELPEWVEVLRPVEMPVQALADDRVETSGPLAGLTGVLPGEEAATTRQKPPLYSAMLQVSERHNLHSGLLDSVLGEARQPRAVRSERRRMSQTGTRLVVALVLIGAVLLSMVLGPLQVKPPAIYPAETADLVAQIDSLPTDGVVLVAAEYQAGLSGEIRLSAQPVLERLMARGLRMVLASTQPNGTALAGQVITAAAMRHGEYPAAEKIVDLGYLAGEASGLQELATRPLRVVRPTTLNGSPLSESPALQGIETVADFAAVLVLTDSLENGQAWIEQVQPALGGKPLLFAASAQAGPLLRPYSDSGQIQGLLTGLAGGAAFEQIVQQPGVSSSYFSAYHGGVVAAILLLMVGVVLQAIVVLFSGKKA